MKLVRKFNRSAYVARELNKRPTRYAFLLGTLTVLGFAPFSIFFLPIATCALLFFILHTQSPIKVFKTSFAFSLGLLLAGTSWIYVSLHNFGGMHPILSALATIFLAAIFSIVPASIQALLARVNPSPKLRLLIILPVGLALSDWCRGWFLTGFPWLAIGYSQIPTSPLANYASIFGIYGVTLACGICSGGVCYFLKNLFFKHTESSVISSSKISLVILTSTLISSITLGLVNWTQKTNKTATSVSLLQGNITQDLKWSPESLKRTMTTYLDMVQKEKSDLILLPETAIPLIEGSVPEWYWDSLRDHAKANKSHILLGIPEKTKDGQFFNSVIHIGGDETQRYRKHHLVPFGDYFPMQAITSYLLKYLNIPMSNFTSGPSHQAPFVLGKQILGVGICYEDVFGEEAIRQLPEATVLSNFTNDAWWGESIGPHQHLQIAQARSIETGRELLRVTNTGITAVINHKGYIVDQAPQFSQTVLRANIHGRKGMTPYSRWGNVPLIFLCLLTLLLCAKSKWRCYKSEKR